MYQVGFTRALTEHVSRDEIRFVSSASGGIFTAYALSANKLGCVERMYRKIDVSTKRELFWQVFAKHMLTDYMDVLLSPADTLEIPLCFPVCFVPLFSTRYYWLHGKYNRVWERYITAATNYPFLKIFPSFLHGRIAIDGGAVDNIPLYPILKADRSLGETDKLDLVLVLHFDARYDYRKAFVTDTPVLDLDLSYCNDFSKAHWDFSAKETDKRLQKSYEYGNSVASRLFAGECSRESIRQAADDIFLEEHALRQRCFSIDGLATFLNSAGRIFRSETHCMKKLY